MAKRTPKTEGPKAAASKARTRSVKNATDSYAARDANYIPQQDIRDEAAHMVRNGASEAILGFDPSAPFSVQLSQVDTLFKNNRWYLISNMRQLLSECFVEIGLIQTVIGVPVDDGFRGGIDIKTKQLADDQIQELRATITRRDDLTQVVWGSKWNRLFGGGGVLIMTDQDPATPLNWGAINKNSKLEFRDVDMWELFFSRQNTSDYATSIDSANVVDPEFYDYYGNKLHNTRVMKMVGYRAPSFIRPRLRGWGVSVVEVLVRSINQYLKATDLGFEVLDEFKLDVFKIKNLANTLLSPNGEEKVRQRIATANRNKNYNNALVMDSEDDFDHKQLSFSGLAEAMQGIRMQVACDLRMPLTKIFGISAAGFNSGEDDIENYNSMIESDIRTKAKPHILKIVELRCQQMFGIVPDDLEVEFKPLRVLSAEQEENVKTQQFNRALQAVQASMISQLDFLNACNMGNLLPIQIDTTAEALSAAGEVDVEEENGADDQETDDASKGEKSKLNPKETKDPKDAKPAKNSLEYDIAAYEADGGDQQYSPWHQRQVMNPGKVDEGLWAHAKEASMRAFGKEKWQFITWFYKQHGGKFE